MTLPAFLGIGALKAGTTTLHAWLEAHPQVSLAEGRKEVMFFDRHWERGVDWYAAHFAHAGGRVPGEVTPSYLFDPHAPARAASVVPGARLMVMLRDPIARLVSQHRFYCQERAYSGDLEAFLADHPNAVDRGLYAAQLRRWLACFPREQLLVLLLEEASADPEAAVARVYAHVGVDPTFVPPNLRERANESGTARLPRLRALARRAASWLYDHDLGAVVQVVKRTGAQRLLVRAKKAGKAPMSDALRRRLTQAYAADLADLSDLLGRDLGAVWPTARPGP